MKRCYLLLSMLLAAQVQGQSPLWGNLEKGPHDVGFRSISAYDLSRPAIVDQEMNGAPGQAVPVAPARQVQIHVWYPAFSKGKPMQYLDYIHELSAELDFSPLDEKKKKAALEKVVAKYSEGRTFKRELLEKVLPMPVAAVRDAKAAGGRFPVLIFPFYYSPMDGSVMCEYLASQGYVVATTSLKGTDSVLPEISPRGLQAMAGDISFVINQVGLMPVADVSRIALMGLGVNASGCAEFMKDNNDVDAFISLDGGIITGFELPMFYQTGFFNPASMTMPMMFIHAPHPSVNPELADTFKYADKYYYKFTQMSEYYFLNNAMLEKYMPGLIGEKPGDVQAGYEWACKYITQFLSHTLKGNAESGVFLKAPPDSHGAIGIEGSFKSALPKPPSLHQLKVISAKEGADGLRSAYERLKLLDPKPFTQLVLADLFNWLAFQRDADFKKRLEVARIWIESFPDGARGQYSLARIYTAKGKPADARPYYSNALELLATDTDIYLDNVVRERIRYVATDELKKPAGN